MAKWPLRLILLVMLASCGGDESGPEANAMPRFTIDDDRITVSGVSAGAYMAGQLHVAHSSVFSGVGLIAAGPYRCAAASVKTALGPCMQGGELPVGELQNFAREQAENAAIDPLENLGDDAIWIFHGTADTIVNADVPAAARSFYESFADSASIVFVNDVVVVHGVPTVDSGVACDTVESPFLNACNYDAAGEMLGVLHGELAERAAAAGELLSVPQPGFEDAEMLDSALLYVPEVCAAGDACGVHVALHGCQQSVEFIGDAFAAGAGYNEWAESNKLLVLYPQVASSRISPLNPLGCWDWWGYTGDDYAAQSGAQVRVIKALLDALAGRTL